MTTHSAIVSNVSTDSDHTITTMHEAKPRIDPSLLTIRRGADTLSKTQSFELKELLKSEYLKGNNESKIIKFINSFEQFELDIARIICYIREDMYK